MGCGSRKPQVSRTELIVDHKAKVPREFPIWPTVSKQQLPVVALWPTLSNWSPSVVVLVYAEWPSFGVLVLPSSVCWMDTSIEPDR